MLVMTLLSAKASVAFVPVADTDWPGYRGQVTGKLAMQEGHSLL
jgi:hypothetical protein